MNRRGFLGGILAACAAPAIVRADSLMRIVPREVLVIPSALPLYWGKSIPQMLREQRELQWALDNARYHGIEWTVTIRQYEQMYRGAR